MPKGAPIYAKGPLWGNDSRPFGEQSEDCPEGATTTRSSLCHCPFGAKALLLPRRGNEEMANEKEKGIYCLSLRLASLPEGLVLPRKAGHQPSGQLIAQPLWAYIAALWAIYARRGINICPKGSLYRSAFSPLGIYCRAVQGPRRGNVKGAL